MCAMKLNAASSGKMRGRIDHDVIIRGDVCSKCLIEGTQPVFEDIKGFSHTLGPVRIYQYIAAVFCGRADH